MPSKTFSQIAESSELRRTFAENATAILKSKGFHGLDMFWQYPGERDGQPADKKNFILLLEDLSKVKQTKW